MTITADTAAQLEALGLAIFDPEITPNANPVLGDHWGKGVGLTGPDPATDAQYYALIAPVMLAIDGRVMAPGFLYTLNVTNALKGRPKHWYLQGVMEYNPANPGSSYGWPANTGMTFIPDQAYGIGGGTNSFGGSMALATCACICHTWAAIIRMWLAGNYPLAVTQPS